MHSLDDTLTEQEKAIMKAESKLTLHSNQPLQSQRLSEVPIDESTDYIIDGYVPASSLTLLSGMPSSGKTTIVSSWVASITRGTKWCGNTVMQGNVLYVLLEDNISRLARVMHDNDADLKKVFVLNQVRTTKPVLSFRSDETFRLPENYDELYNEILAIKPVLVVIDALGRAVGSKRNAVQEEIAETLRGICIKTGIGMVLINHLKNGYYKPQNIESRIANSSAFHALARISYLCVKDTSSQDRAIVTIKNNLEQDLPPFVYRIRKKQDGKVKLEQVGFYSYRINENAEIELIKYHSEMKETILACLAVYGDCTPLFIAMTTDINHSTVKVYLRQLLQDGSIIQKEGYKYALPANIVLAMDVKTLESLQAKKAETEQASTDKSYAELRTVTHKLQSDSTISNDSASELTTNEVTELYENAKNQSPEKTVSSQNTTATNECRDASVKNTVRSKEESEKWAEYKAIE